MRIKRRRVTLVKVLAGSILLYALLLMREGVSYSAPLQEIDHGLENLEKNFRNESKDKTDSVTGKKTATKWFQNLPQEEPRLVILLTYQRCGSSYLGEIFNQNEDAFYWFEPLDGAYSSMYGLEQGWAVPSDITNFPNGSLRVPTLHELQVTYNTLRGLLSCDFRTVPNGVLWHDFFVPFKRQMKRLHKYFKCARRGKKDQLGLVSKMCHLHIASLCPKRQDASHAFLDVCREHIPWNYTAEGTTGKAMGVRTDTSWMRNWEEQFIHWPESPNEAFKHHALCQEKLRRKLFSACVPMLNNACNTSVRSLKTIRLTMDVVGQLIRHFPNVRIIHYYRDPRSVALSRTRMRNIQSIYAKDDAVKEAKLYCQTLVRDITLRREMQSMYPHTFHELRYGELVSDPINVAAEIYRFIDKDLPLSVVQWLNGSTSGLGKLTWTRTNATLSRGKWEHLPLASVRGINKVCRGLYNLVPGLWPLTDLI